MTRKIISIFLLLFVGYMAVRLHVKCHEYHKAMYTEGTVNESDAEVTRNGTGRYKTAYYCINHLMSVLTIQTEKLFVQHKAFIDLSGARGEPAEKHPPWTKGNFI